MDTSRFDERGKPEGLEIHVVEPVDQDEELTDFPRSVSMQSTFYCNCIGGRVTGYGDVIGALVLREPNPFLRFTQDVLEGREVEWLEMHSDFARVLYEALRAAVNRSRSGPSAPA